jgi:hypothetical protein
MGLYYRIATGTTTVRDTVILSCTLFIAMLAGVSIGLLIGM